MAPAYHIGTDDGLISIQVASETDLVDLYELGKSVLASEEYDPELPLLIDLRGMRLDWREAATEPLLRFALDNFRGRAGSMAAVIDSEMSRELVAGIYWLACAVGGTEVFDDYDHALKWLIRREFVGASHASLANFPGTAAAGS
jgi:hypothetical protein